VIRAILAKDLKVLWASPLPWVVGVLLHAVLGLLYVNELTVRAQALVQPMVPLAGFLVLALVPLLAMRSFADERRQGTLDVLRAVPVPTAALVVGKWLAVWLTAVAVLAPALATVGAVARMGDPDGGPVVAGFLGLALVASALAALGVAASAFTSSSPVAAVMAFFISLLLWFAHVGSETLAAGGLVARLSISERLRTFAGGGIDTGDVAALVAVTVVLLVVASVGAARRAPRSGILLVLAVLTLAVAADAHPTQVDLTADRSLTLSVETERIVDEVDAPLRITAFLDRADPTRVAAPTLLGRYRRRNHRISFRLRDPSASSGELRRLGVDPTFGGIALEARGRIEHAPAATEQDVTAAIARLLRGAPADVCVATGHGEADVGATDGAGLSTAAELLRTNGYRVSSLDLLTAVEVGSSCDALLVANPTSPLGDASSAIGRYLDRGGRAVVLVDPASTEELTEVLAPFALSVRRGLVLEGEPDERFRDDPLRPVVRDYRSGTSIVRRLAPTFFPAVQAVIIDESQAARVPGLTVTPPAMTSRLSFLETEPQEVEFDPSRDLPGPVTVAAAADRSRQSGGGVARTRVVLGGDGDFATNDFVGQAGNGQLLVRSLDWATEEESLVTVSAHVARLRPLDLTEGRLRYLRLLSSGIIPGLFAVLGALVWAVRRGR
jgi:ABC-type transport system involved in multi-copper enzyme maturation permease subunit